MPLVIDLLINDFNFNWFKWFQHLLRHGLIQWLSNHSRHSRLNGDLFPQLFLHFFTYLLMNIIDYVSLFSLILAFCNLVLRFFWHASFIVTSETLWLFLVFFCMNCWPFNVLNANERWCFILVIQTRVTSNLV